MAAPLVQVTPEGLYCSPGDFYIDPWQPVQQAVITHAHSDHARSGHGVYYCARKSLPLLEHRLGTDWSFETRDYKEQFDINGVKVSLHPAGHILGSSQVRVEWQNDVWVISGDYKRDADPTCDAFEVVPCNTFITEATFALPIYRWQDTPQTVGDIFSWWQDCKQRGQTALLFCYALGKAQRVLSELTAFTSDPVYLHGAIVTLTDIYRRMGIPMVPTIPVSEIPQKENLAGQLVLAPPSAFRSLWMKRFKHLETGFASGWMRVRAGRRHKGYDRGFVLSDHADWPQLLQTIRETGASNILITHGRTDVLSNYLKAHGIQASALRTAYGDEEDVDGHSHATEGSETE